MARARNIKPSIYRNEILGTLDPLVTILFTSLWCLADRDGKLEDRPLRIKADTFPYRENIDINGYLTVLAQHGFIKRYAVAGVAIIQVCKFKEHQSPHKTERDSVLPDEQSQVIENKQENNLTVKQPLKDDGLTEALPPESISLIPDSLIPECGKREIVRGSRLPKNFEPDFDFAKQNGIANPNEELAKFRDYWNSQAGQKAVKTDWQATWRNWVRNAKKPLSGRAEPVEPAWRREQRERTANAVPGIAAKSIYEKQIIDVEAYDVVTDYLG